jgi:hypothetical protein
MGSRGDACHRLEEGGEVELEAAEAARLENPVQTGLDEGLVGVIGQAAEGFAFALAGAEDVAHALGGTQDVPGVG